MFVLHLFSSVNSTPICQLQPNLVLFYPHIRPLLPFVELIDPIAGFFSTNQPFHHIFAP